MGELTHWLALSMAPGVGGVLFKRLLEAFGSPQAVLRASTRDLNRVEGVGPKVASSVRHFRWEERVEKELRAAQMAGAKLVTWADREYPASLKEIYDPPPLLYVRGSLGPREKTAVAIVGSRYPTYYGKSAAQRIAYGLSRMNVTVVSGLARGVDSCAHRGALAAGGGTIAVLGCGVDIVYPPENGDLFDDIAARGAIVSEFPMGTPPESDHFPIRNRVISGLSRGVAVVEATLRSGSLITARFALEQGRDVYAVPGNVDSARSAGTNRLIRDGAKLVTRAEDILEELPPQSWQIPAEAPLPPAISEEERKVYSLLGAESVHIDEVIARSAYSSARVSAILLRLELGGHIRQLPGMRFVKP